MPNLMGGGSKYGSDHNENYRVATPHVNDTKAQVQPTNNPYHWEIPANGHSNVYTWVEASWTRMNEIVRRGAGARTLKRNAAIRRSGKDCTALSAGTAATPATASPATRSEDEGGPSSRLLPCPRMHRRFSFEVGERREQLIFPIEKLEEEKVMSERTTRVDSGIQHGSLKRSTRFHESLDERPRVARTFSEILGQPFVLTALAKED